MPLCCDIDGTLALMSDRSPFDWHRVGEDKLNAPIASIVRKYSKKPSLVRVILVSGRDSICRPETEAWLKDNYIEYTQLIMRPKGDNRKDSIVKQELYETYIEPDYKVLFVLDDRDQVVKMWRELGLTCLQVAEGDF